MGMPWPRCCRTRQSEIRVGSSAAAAGLLLAAAAAAPAPVGVAPTGQTGRPAVAVGRRLGAPTPRSAALSWPKAIGCLGGGRPRPAGCR